MTHLVFKRLQKDNPDSGWAVVGFYSIAAKTIKLNKNTKLSSRMKKRVEKFSDAENDEDYYTFSAPLIGQLGKNYKDGLNRLASGKELLDLALDTIVAAQNEIGGKLTYLECEDNEKLISFYTNNGFAVFNKKINIDNKTGEKYCLVQLIKYMSE
ncbi:MAG: N-acetyltransferase [Clostridiales bacterium]|nr:N-acetyltransferase [Clostridiales bacterium]